MSALITSVEHALAVAAQDVVKTAKFVETSVLPVLKSAQANQSTIETVTSLVSPQAANIERAGFAVLGVIINAIDAAGAAAGANGLKGRISFLVLLTELLDWQIGLPCLGTMPSDTRHHFCEAQRSGEQEIEMLEVEQQQRCLVARRLLNCNPAIA
jgi:hypothetical protein